MFCRKICCAVVQARQKLSRNIREGRTALFDGNASLALDYATQCDSLAEGLQDHRASRAVTRLKASALRQVRPAPCDALCNCTSKTAQHKFANLGGAFSSWQAPWEHKQTPRPENFARMVIARRIHCWRRSSSTRSTHQGQIYNTSRTTETFLRGPVLWLDF